MTTYIRLPQLLQRVPVAKSTIWRWVKAGTFPAPVKLGPKVTAWPEHQVAAWELRKNEAP